MTYFNSHFRPATIYYQYKTSHSQQLLQVHADFNILHIL